MLKDKFTSRRIILASHSPRRRELLAGAGVDFTLADSYDVDESFPADMPAGKVAEYLAAVKSDAYPTPLHPEDILITADTVVILDGRILGKPRDRAHAVEMLSSLSGKKHTVVTGVAIRSGRKRESFSVETDVWFRTLKPDEIDYYVDTYNPFDKAGSYGIQEWIGYVAIEKIAGSFYNVMGLPIQTLYVRLGEFMKENTDLKT